MREESVKLDPPLDPREREREERGFVKLDQNRTPERERGREESVKLDPPPDPREREREAVSNCIKRLTGLHQPSFAD